MLGLLLRKELTLILREPSVRFAVILPFIIYSIVGGAVAGVGEQVREAIELKGYSVAVVGVDGGCVLARFVAASLEARGVNATYACGDVDPLSLLLQGYTAVLRVNVSDGRPSFTVYLKTSLSRLMASLAAPSAIMGAVQGNATGNVSFTAFLLLGGRLWSLEELQAVFNTGLWLAYALVFVAIASAGISSAIVASEREERMLETVLSLPVSRREIAVAKALAALAVGSMIAVSAMAGLYAMLSASKARAELAIHYYGPAGLAVYMVAVAATSLLVVALSMLVSLFSTTYRSAQTLSAVVALPFLAVMFLPMMGLPETPLTAIVPYAGVIYAALYPLVPREAAVAGALATAVYAALALLAFARLLGSELAVTGPETLRQLLRRRRGAGG